MTQDSDDLLAQVFAGIPAPTQEYNESSTYEVKTTHVENGHTTHTESHSYEVLEYTSERNDDVSEMVRRSSHEFQHFLDNTGIIGNTEEKDHSVSHHEESHLETHHEEHHHEDHSVSGADEGHHQYDTVPTLNYVPDFEDQQHEMTEHQNHLHEDQQSTVSSVRSAVSDATSVSVHSSVSQKSAQEYQVQQTVFVEEKQDDAHSVSTVKSSHHSSQHSHVSEKTIGSSSASTTSQATTINKYGVNAVADNTSEPSTPIAVQKSSQHDALIEQFKNLHPKEPSVVSSVAPSVPVPVSEDYSSDEEDRVMTVTYTQYAFDSDNVEQKKTVVPEHEDHVSHVEHHEEHHQSSDFDGLSNGFHHAITDHNQQVFTRQDSDESMHFETAEYVSEEHHSTEEHHQETHHHEFNESSYGHTTEPMETIHYQHEQETIPVFHHTNTQHVHVPPASHAPPPPMSSSDSSSDDDTLLDEHVHHHHHHHHHETHEDSRGLVPNVVGPRVRDELRPVSLSNNARETHHHSTSRTTQHAPVAHVTPVSHVVDHSEKSSAKLDHREHLTPIIDPSAFIRKTSTHHEEVIHHSKFEREEEQESNYDHSDEKITHHRHHEHHEEGHGEVHHHHHHREPEREDEVFNGPSVKDLRSRFDNGVPVDVGYNLHKIHHHSTIITESRAPAVHEHHEVEVHSHHEKDEHHEHHHTAENEHTSEVEEQLVRQLLETEKEQHKEHKEHHHHHHHHKEHKEHHHHHHHEHKRESVAHSELNHGNDSHHHVMSYEELTGSHPKGHQEQKVHHQESDSAEEQRAVADILSMFGGGARLRRPDHVEDLRIHQRTQSVRSSIDVQPQEHQYETKSRTVTESTVTRSRGNTAQSVQRSHAPTLIQIHDHQETTAPAAPVAATRHSSNDQFQSVRVVKNVRKFVSQWGQKDFVPPSSPVITVPRLSASPSPRGNFEHVFPQPTSRKSTVTSQVSHKTNTTVSQNHHHEEPIKRDSVCSISTTTTVHSEAPRSVVVEHEYSSAPVSDDDSESYCIQPLSARRMMFERGSRGYSINRKTHGELRPMVNVLED